MKKLSAVILLLSALTGSAQDSTRTFNHELGFNSVSLIKQLTSNNPSSTLSQLPYDFFYNLHYKSVGGLRLGVGVNNKFTETLIEGQPHPRQTNNVEFHYRFGITYNIVNSKRIRVNVFADYTGDVEKNETVTSTTVQTFPNPQEDIVTVSSDITKTSGVQAGAGFQYNLHKHLALYVEMPFGIYVSKITSLVSVTESGVKDELKTTSRVTTTRAFVPTTVYLVLKF